jgi:3-dehydroquinate synthase
MEFPLRVSETKVSTIYSGDSAWKTLNYRISELQGNAQKIFILVDDNTDQFCLPVFLSEVNTQHNPEILRISPGELSKNAEVAVALWNELTTREAGRDSVLINLGGGVVSDLGGFVASTYKRGIPFINIPTTLMAMADASVGGKTAINLQSIKNTVGTFCLPEATYLFPVFLTTLDNANLLSGLAEIFKIALVADHSFWKYLKTLTPGRLLKTSFQAKEWEEIISKSAGIKCNIVEEDFAEKNERAKLNFGHTLGHAIESLSFQANHEPISHGMAVSIGILCEAFLSRRYSGLKEEDFKQITGLFLSTFGYYPLTETDIPEILSFVFQDKKKSKGELNFTLLEHPGKALINQSCDTTSIREALESYRLLDPNF